MPTFGIVWSSLIGRFASCSLPANSQDPGRAIYDQYCATCHGLDARGGNERMLFDDRWPFGRVRGRPWPGRIYFAGGITDDHFEPTSPPLNYFNGNGLGLATDYTGDAGHVGGPISIFKVVV